ncbi:MAG: hypothetical protein Q8P76_04190 [bacterium]|nr:hypothetical protein [bacterium]
MIIKRAVIVLIGASITLFGFYLVALLRETQVPLLLIPIMCVVCFGLVIACEALRKDIWNKLKNKGIGHFLKTRTILLISSCLAIFHEVGTVKIDRITGELIPVIKKR